MPVRRKDTVYASPDCLVAGCREVETHGYRVRNSNGPATESYCNRHAQRMIWSEYMKHVKETGRRQ